MAAPRILCIAPNWMGDTLLARPAIASLGSAGAEVEVLARGALGRLVEDIPGVHRVHATPAGGRLQRLRTALGLRRRGFEAAVVLPPSFSAALAAHLSGARARIGFGGELRRGLLTHAPRTPARDVHLALQHLQLARATLAALRPPAAASSFSGAAVEGPGAAMPPLVARPDELAAAERLLRSHGITAGPYLVVAPGARYGPAKRYPPDRFAAAADRVARARHAAVLLVGETADAEAASAVRLALPQAHDLTGQTDLASLLGLLAASAGVLANDSGTMHLAAALGRPVVGIFGSTSPEWTRPLGPCAGVVVHRVWCAPCFAPTCVQDFGCMLGLGPGTVAEALLERMQPLPARPLAGTPPV